MDRDDWTDGFHPRPKHDRWNATSFANPLVHGASLWCNLKRDSSQVNSHVKSPTVKWIYADTVYPSNWRLKALSVNAGKAPEITWSYTQNWIIVFFQIKLFFQDIWSCSNINLDIPDFSKFLPAWQQITQGLSTARLCHSNHILCQKMMESHEYLGITHHSHISQLHLQPLVHDMCEMLDPSYPFTTCRSPPYCSWAQAMCRLGLVWVPLPAQLW